MAGINPALFELRAGLGAGHSIAQTFLIELGMTSHRLCIAPMMDHTDRHFRYLLRLRAHALIAWEAHSARGREVSILSSSMHLGRKMRYDTSWKQFFLLI